MAPTLSLQTAGSGSPPGAKIPGVSVKNISSLRPPILITIAIFFTGASGAQAEIVCPAFVPVPFAKIETKIDLGNEIIQAKNIDCKKIGIGADLIADIQKFLGRELTTPPKLIFRMVDHFDNAFFDPSDISLNVPHQIMMGKYAKNPVHTIPVWAHEYGHAILDHNLLGIAPSWLKQVKKRASEDAGSAIGILDFIVAPYHEFFADVLTVLYTEEGSSVADALAMTGFLANPEGSPTDCPNQSSPECRPRNRTVDVQASLRNRDFTDRANQFGRWKPVRPDDIHNLLAPTRYHVWKYYLDNPEFRREKAKMAGIVVDAIIGDVSRRLKRMAGSRGEITRARFNEEVGDPVRANREFMTTLDRYFEAGLDLERR